MLAGPRPPLLWQSARDSHNPVHTAFSDRVLVQPHNIIFPSSPFLRVLVPGNEVTRLFLLGTSGEVNIEKAVGGIADDVEGESSLIIDHCCSELFTRVITS